MAEKAIVKQLLTQGNGMFAAFQATEAGLHRQQLAGFVKTGILERADRGIYIRAGGLDDALFWMQQRASKIVYSHETALFLHRITDRTPTRYSITVPSSYKASEALKKSCKIYYIKKELINLGKIEKPSGMGHTIITYDLERTLCDIIRSRNKIDSQIVIEALKNYARSKYKNLHRLYKYAENFGVEKILYNYLEVLL
ncbi:MAG: type IV toxin-antitoxin system AbiEi family antitoxin domain-containing protein [Treponema sp.]|jgi:predicted transcriptional regulator of viral defense system|nr:type IV toxin-antitoxin system AbiEi family antitoxin domain-containing protein [Treponema sp.]